MKHWFDFLLLKYAPRFYFSIMKPKAPQERTTLLSKEIKQLSQADAWDFAERMLNETSHGKITKTASSKSSKTRRLYELNGTEYIIPSSFFKINGNVYLVEKKTAKNALPKGAMSQVKMLTAKDGGLYVQKKIKLPSIDEDTTHLLKQMGMISETGDTVTDQNHTGNPCIKKHYDACSLRKDAAISLQQPPPEQAKAYVARKKAFEHEAQIAETLGFLAGKCIRHNKMYMLSRFRGKNLEQILRERDRSWHLSTLDEKYTLAIKTVAAIAAIHEKNIYLGDIKPANLVMDEDGVVNCIDFGFSGTGLNKVLLSVQGTAFYLPSHPKNHPRKSLDIFALMRVLYIPPLVNTFKEDRVYTDHAYSIFNKKDVYKEGLTFIDTADDRATLQKFEPSTPTPLALMQLLIKKRSARRNIRIDPALLDNYQSMLLINDILSNVVQNNDIINRENLTHLNLKNELYLKKERFTQVYKTLLKEDSLKKLPLLSFFNTSRSTLHKNFFELAKKAVQEVTRGKDSRTVRVFKKEGWLVDGKLTLCLEELLKSQQTSFITTTDRLSLVSAPAR